MKENVTKILSLTKERKFYEIREIILQLNKVHIAEVMECLNAEQAVLIFRMLPKDRAVDVFNYLEKDFQENIISSITDKEIKNIIDEIYFDDMIDLLEEMPAKVVKKLLKYSNVEERRLINQFLNYPEDSAGSLMTIEYMDLNKNMTVREAIEYIKSIAIEKQNIYTCYVINNERKLEGIISLRKLILSDKDEKIENIMNKDVVYVNTYQDQEKIAVIFRKYDLIAIPVVDNENRLTGIITIDDIMDVIYQENTEDFQKMAAMAPSEQKYLDTSIWNLAKNRIMWLVILMISATFTGNIIRRFEEVLKSMVLLTAFIPMLMDTGGNAGSQSATLIIRSLALGEIQGKDTLKVLWKEFRVSIIVGICLSVINFLRIFYLEKVPFNVALTVSLTIVFTIMLAKIVGAVLPIIAKKLKLDPAIMASPLITTIVDAASLIVYFSVARILLGL